MGINAGDVDYITVMSDSVYDGMGKGAVIPAKLFIPVRILILGTEDVDDFFRLLCRSSKISLCSVSVGFRRSHSSRISTKGLAYLAIVFL